MQWSATLAGFLLASLITAPIWSSASAQADGSVERERLTLIARQLEHIERQADEIARIAHESAQNTRYYFDAPRLKADVRRVRAGIDAYLNPARALPRDVGELIGDYTAEAAPR
ncbi:MAG: hypothetical protein LBP99_06245 [Azoarcus sp.]|jgi:RAQPRD family integrative conjugative element protein|nr:hypothetical protein [Azoarcus sp.]